MINKDKCKFPFKTVSYYLHFLLENNFIDYFDDHIEDYNSLLLNFEDECDSHYKRMKILKYTISKIMEKDNISNKYEYFKKSLFSNIEVLNKKEFEIIKNKIIEENKKLQKNYDGDLPF